MEKHAIVDENLIQMNHIYIYVGNWVKLSGCLDLDLVWFKFSTTSLVNQCMLGMFLNTWTSWGPCERAGGVYVQVSGKPLYSQIEPKATVAVGAEYLRNLSLSCVEASHAMPRAMTIIAFSRDHQDFSNCYKDVIIYYISWVSFAVSDSIIVLIQGMPHSHTSPF